MSATLGGSKTLLPVASGRETRRAVWRLVRPRSRQLALALSTLVLGSLLGLATPIILGRIVDIVIDERGASAVLGPAGLLALVAVGAAGFLAWGQRLVARVGEPALADLRESVMDRTLHLDLATVEASGSGDLVSRVTGDVEVVAEAVSEVLDTFAVAALTISLTLVGLGALDWRFALAGLCAVPIQVWTLSWYLGKAAPVFAAQRVAEGERAQQLLDSIGGAATVRAFRLGPEHLGKVADRSLAAIELVMLSMRFRTRFFGQLNVAEFIALSAILVTGFFMVRGEIVTVGATTAAALLFIRLFDPINVVLGLIDQAQEAGAGLARLVGVANMPAPVEPEHAGVPADASVRMSDVHFAYRDGHDVLRGIDLDVRPGQRVSLVGATGAGKTTLAKLLSGIQHTGRGGIELGGVAIGSLGGAAIRETVALVTQEVHVFAGPLADDLLLARPKATDAELEEALQTVSALAWARALPDGLHTVVGDGGHRLTSTQSQQVALARLHLADRPVAILDEATAEAGSVGARQIEAAANRVLAGRTSLVVAHRLSQAAASDRIVVLERGKVVESGTHDDLVAREGAYAALWQAWDTHR